MFPLLSFLWQSRTWVVQPPVSSNEGGFLLHSSGPHPVPRPFLCFYSSPPPSGVGSELGLDGPGGLFRFIYSLIPQNQQTLMVPILQAPKAFPLPFSLYLSTAVVIRQGSQANTWLSLPTPAAVSSCSRWLPATVVRLTVSHNWSQKPWSFLRISQVASWLSACTQDLLPNRCTIFC